MLRGTVYFETLQPNGDVIIRREVVSLPAETPGLFIDSVRNVNPEAAELGYTVSYGPIGPPWRKL